MRRLYSNPNSPRRTINTSSARSVEQLKAEFAPLKRYMAEREAQQHNAKPKRLRVSAGHLRSVLRHMRHVRRCRHRMRYPRSVPKSVMETIERLRLV